MENYIVLTKEFTSNIDECSVFIRGNFNSFEKAKELMKELKENSLKNFPNEYIENENEKCISFRFEDDDNYKYEIEIIRCDCQIS